MSILSQLKKKNFKFKGLNYSEIWPEKAILEKASRI